MKCNPARRADYIMGEARWYNRGEALKVPLGFHITALWTSLMLPDLHLGDRVRLRKPHACGGYEWRVVRLGADIGLECLTCGRRILLTRRKLARRLKVILPPDDGEPPDA